MHSNSAIHTRLGEATGVYPQLEVGLGLLPLFHQVDPPRLDAGVVSLCHVMPRGMRYSRSRATSIDLFVSELIAHSQHANVVIAEPTADPLPAPLLVAMPSYGFAKTLRRSKFIADAITRLAPSAVLVQQHMPSATMINRRVKQPVILQRHNFMERPSAADLCGRYSYRLKAARLNRLAGLTFVSDAVLEHFERNWPDVNVPRTVICNGFASNEWMSRPVRDDTVLVVGRAAPEKGILEAAQGLAEALGKVPGWRARFMLSEEKVHPAYYDQVCNVLSRLGERASVHLNVPFERVKAEFERAARR